MAQELYNKFDEDTQKELSEFVHVALKELYENEVDYTAYVYDKVGLTHDVKSFVRYNANKALQNLGFEPYFKEEPVNPIVLNGLETTTKSHDFFSQKGNGYKKAVVEAIKDEDFIFDE